MSTTERKYATAKHPSIEALVHGLYKYKEKKQAIARLKSIREHFVLSKEQPAAEAADPQILLWIKGFDVTPEEDAQGYTGHFALVSITTMKNGIFTLKAEKQLTPVASHPQKKRLQSKHPNWGHPVMRAVKKAKLYKTIQAANAELELLHLEFPEVSIPGPGKLYIIIYEKREGIARPTHKIALEIIAQTGGGFLITWRDNEKTLNPKLAAAPTKTMLAQGEVKTPTFETPGHFVSVEAVRKLNKRRRPPTAAVVEVKETDTGKFGATEKERKKRKKKKKKPAAVKEVVITEEGEALKLTKFRESELVREQTRRRRTTLFDVRRAEKRDDPK